MATAPFHPLLHRIPEALLGQLVSAYLTDAQAVQLSATSRHCRRSLRTYPLKSTLVLDFPAPHYECTVLGIAEGGDRREHAVTPCVEAIRNGTIGQRKKSIVACERIRVEGWEQAGRRQLLQLPSTLDCLTLQDCSEPHLQLFAFPPRLTTLRLRFSSRYSDSGSTLSAPWIVPPSLTQLQLERQPCNFEWIDLARVFSFPGESQLRALEFHGSLREWSEVALPASLDQLTVAASPESNPPVFDLTLLPKSVTKLQILEGHLGGGCTLLAPPRGSQDLVRLRELRCWITSHGEQRRDRQRRRRWRQQESGTGESAEEDEETRFGARIASLSAIHLESLDLTTADPEECSFATLTSLRRLKLRDLDSTARQSTCVLSLPPDLRSVRFEFERNHQLPPFPPALEELDVLGSELELPAALDLRALCNLRRLTLLAASYEGPILLSPSAPLTHLTLSRNFQHFEHLLTMEGARAIALLSVEEWVEWELQDAPFPADLSALSSLQFLKRHLPPSPIEISALRFPASLRHLHLNAMDREISDIQLPPLLTHLYLKQFNGSLREVRWPRALQRLSLGDKHNRPLRIPEDWTPPSSLEELRLSFVFNLESSHIQLPPSLKVLLLGEQFQQPIDALQLPPGLLVLKFLNRRWSPDLTQCTLPDTLKFLSFSASPISKPDRAPSSSSSSPSASGSSTSLPALPPSLLCLQLPQQTPTGEFELWRTAAPPTCWLARLPYPSDPAWCLEDPEVVWNCPY